MIQHRLHKPNTTPIECRPYTPAHSCDFCHAEGTVKNCKCSSCGTFFPSPLSYKDPIRSPLRRKRKEFQPRTDGIDGPVLDQNSEQDELFEYSDLLNALEVGIDQDDHNAADEVPTSQELEESLPWS